MFSVLVVDGGDLFNARRFPLPAMLRTAMQAGSAQSIDRLTVIIRASPAFWPYQADRRWAFGVEYGGPIRRWMDCMPLGEW